MSTNMVQNLLLYVFMIYTRFSFVELYFLRKSRFNIV